MRQRPVVAAAAFMLGFLKAGAAFAAEYKSQPWQKWFQPAGSPVMEGIVSLNEFLFYIEIGIVLFVTVILLIIIRRFNAKANPVPSKTSHNTLLEIAWTAIPIIILVIVAIPSLKLLYYSDRTQNAEMTLKVTGHQWYWSYEYPDNGG
ncbi:MAG TPA: cytochrome c oxidase subunit II, partial [Alphaproteobacteria bacterium]|nr:cytochrome c oxidase subunit II [Alphaproteobacteria bacterium]